MNNDHIKEEQNVEIQIRNDDPYLGQIVAGKYELVKCIGRGGMGLVYKAMHKQLNRWYAVKVMLRDNYQKQSAAHERFIQEARTVSGLHHQNLIGVHDFGTLDDNSPYLVMDFVEGTPLAAWLETSGPLKQDEAITLVLQLVDGLACAHGKGVVHRDLKPSNIMITKDSKGMTARILDFGIAKVVDINDEERKTLTGTGEIIGTPHYMSPEQCMGHKIDYRSDIYSLGCVFYEILTKQPPFAANSPIAILMQHMNDRPPQLKTVASATPVRPELERIIQQMLEKDPELRYQCLEDLRTDLTLVQEGKNPVKEHAQSRQRRRKLLSIGAKLSLPAFLILGTLFGAIFCVAWTNTFKPEWMRTWDAAHNDMTQQNFNDADVKFIKATSQAESAGEKSSEVLKMLIAHSRLLRSLENNKRAADVATKAMVMNRDVKDTAKQGEILDAIAEAQLADGQFEKAKEAGREALKTKQESNARPLYVAHSMQRLGQIYRKLKQYPEAVAVDKDAIKLYETAGNKLAAADMYEQLANVYADQGMHNESLENASISYDLNVQERGATHPLTMKVSALVESQKHALKSNRQRMAIPAQL